MLAYRCHAYDCPITQARVPDLRSSPNPVTLRVLFGATVMYLQSLGATREVFSAFQPHAAHGLILARVAISQRDQYRLYTEAGEVDAEPSGALWHRTPDRASMP